MTSSPRRTTAWIASKIASVAPLVIVMSLPGSTVTLEDVMGQTAITYPATAVNGMTGGELRAFAFFVRFARGGRGDRRSSRPT